MSPYTDEAPVWLDRSSWRSTLSDSALTSNSSVVSETAFTSTSELHRSLCCAHRMLNWPRKSFAVSGEPSDHSTPGCRLTVTTYLVPAGASAGGVAFGSSAETSLYVLVPGLPCWVLSLSPSLLHAESSRSR